MPTKLRNIIFIAICICALSIAFIYQGAKWAHVLPASFNNGTYSYLEGAKLQTRPKLTLSNIKKGTFQTQTEKWLTTKVPKRDSVMLLNAKVQRGIIKTANLACGFETIPTFYGSKYIYNSKTGTLAECSVQITDQEVENLNDAAVQINAFSEVHPELTSVTVALPSNISRSEINPSYLLTSKPQGQDFRFNSFFSKLNSNVSYVDLSCDDLEQYQHEFFSTDTHWNIQGATRAYTEIMKQAYPELRVASLKNFVTYEQPAFYGNLARNGLLIPKVSDKIKDYTLDLSNTEISINGKQASSESISHSQLYQEHRYNTNQLVDRYTEYFHQNPTDDITFKSNNNTSRDLLIIGDSHMNCCERFFAASFDKVIRIDQRYNKIALSNIIEAEGITDVLLLVAPARLNSSVLTKWSD